MPDLPPDPTPGPAATPPHLPAPLPQTTALLRRAQGTLEVLRDVVQEGSAEYWYERGKAASSKEEWEKAEYAFRSCIKIDQLHWRGTLQLALAIAWQQDRLCYKAPSELRQEAFLLRQRQAEFIANLIVTTAGFFVDWHFYQEELTTDEWRSIICEINEGNKYDDDSLNIQLAKVIIHTIIVNFDRDFVRNQIDIIYEKNKVAILENPIWFRLSAISWNDKFNQSKAIDNYTVAIALCPQSAALHLERGSFYSRKAVDRLSDFNKAIELDPHYARAYIYRAGIHAQMGNLSEAVADHNFAINLLPNADWVYWWRAHFNARIKNNSDAIIDFDRAIELNSEDAMYYGDRARVKEQMKDFSGAIKDYDECLKMESYNIFWNFGRASAKFNQGDYYGAIQDYDICLRVSPDSKTYLARAEVKRVLGDMAGALDDEMQASKLKKK